MADHTILTRIPKSCPYTIRLLCTSDQAVTYLIREKDTFGEYPNIFVKVYYHSRNNKPVVLILSDSGTGLEVTTPSKPRTAGEQYGFNKVTRWNIASFLEITLNPSHAAPYVVLTTHCHYDHICGLQHLLDEKADITVRSSSYDKSYLTPWSNLQKHSLCGDLGLRAPQYDIQWVDDNQRVTYYSEDGQQADSSITVFHTPGHTSDSMSWYDHETRMLCVGDMSYERESDETKSGSNGQWMREPAMPVMFDRNSNINDWRASMHRLLDFVRGENQQCERQRDESRVKPVPRYRQDGQGDGVGFCETTVETDEWSLVTTLPRPSRVVLCAAHVTVATDAESALLDIISFMLRIQLDQVPRTKVDDRTGSGDMWLWDDCLSCHRGQRNWCLVNCAYSVRAPWSTIHYD